MSGRFVLVVIAAILIMTFFNEIKKKEEKRFEECVSRGIKYYKDIGSYPRLAAPPNEGRSAADVAIERCGITTTAF
ncbi:MAG: hypothetical protein HKP41_07705 [Desulfobacterales bacterium]|nr:hypothetical protein [Desulfobacterales bacterium]